MKRETILVAGIILLLWLLLFLYKKPREKVTSKIKEFIFPDFIQCGVAPDLLDPRRGFITWCIDPRSGLEFRRSQAPPTALIFGLSDAALIERSLKLNRGSSA